MFRLTAPKSKAYVQGCAVTVGALCHRGGGMASRRRRILDHFQTEPTLPCAEALPAQIIPLKNRPGRRLVGVGARRQNV